MSNDPSTRPAAPRSGDARARLLERARELLGQERERTLAALRDREADVAAIVAASEGSNADDEHDPEGATIAYERAQVDALARLAVDHLDAVTAALHRVEDGSYGVCTVCGLPIPEERLEARPTATTHVACAG
ncbi:TraR/DksA C4-type zinc finger protein [Phycicoccus ginsengisoli]